MPETVVINSNDTKATNKIYCYILHTVLLVTILLLKIVTIHYDCIKYVKAKIDSTILTM